MTARFEARIARASELAAKYPAARELLEFYGRLARFQQTIYSDLESAAQADVRVLQRYFPSLLDLVNQCGPPALAEFGARFSSAEAQQKALLGCWEGEVEDQAAKFYARSLVQPFAEHLASRGQAEAAESASNCPFCSARPVAAVLRGEGDGGKRWLLCSMCSTEWPFRRVLCPKCGEEDKDKLPIYTAPEFEHVRIEACDACKTYVKAIDLTRDGRAVPVVDEIASVALTIWAEEHGYTKLEPNLLGL